LSAHDTTEPIGDSILVVDNDAAIRQMVGSIIELEGYRVVTADNGAAALREIARARPGLILLDMRMPEMDGWEFARALRAHPARIPVVVMTAGRDPDQWAREIGAVDFLAKPFDIDELVSKVREHFAGRVAR
jgi:CheY-like chemotaxis protein